MSPRGVGVDLCDHLIELLDETHHLFLRLGRDGEDLAGEPGELSVGVDVDRVTLAVAAVGLEAELFDRLFEGLLIGRNPLAADLEHRSVDHIGPEPPAHAVARFEHRDRQARLLEFVRGGEAGRTRADDDDVSGDLSVGHAHSFVGSALSCGLGVTPHRGGCLWIPQLRLQRAPQRRRRGPRGAGRPESPAAEGSESRCRTCRRSARSRLRRCTPWRPRR